jgi:hypothetical protein
VANQYGGGYYMPPRPILRGPAPRSVVYATWLLFLRAGLGALAIVVVLASRTTFKRQLVHHDPTFSAARIDSLVTAATVIVLVAATLGMVLSVVLAFGVRKGQDWARIVTYVVAGLGIVAGVASITQTAPMSSHIVSLVAALLDVVLVTLLAQPQNNRYFRGSR